MEEIKTIDGKTFEEVLEENKKLYSDALWDNMDPEIFTEYVLCKHEYDMLFICGLTYKEWLIAKTMIALTHGEIYSIYNHEHYIIFED